MDITSVFCGSTKLNVKRKYNCLRASGEFETCTEGISGHHGTESHERPFAFSAVNCKLKGCKTPSL